MELRLLGILLLIVVVVSLWFVFRKRRRTAQLLREIRGNWGKARPGSFTLSELDSIALYHNLQTQQSDTWLDQNTCSALNLDQVFAYLDRTNSKVGQQFLFHLLRTPQLKEEPLLQFEQVVNCLRDKKLREDLQLDLHPLNRKAALFLPHLFLGELPQLGRWRFVFLSLFLAALISALSAIVNHTFVWILIPLVIANMATSVVCHRHLQPFIHPLRMLNVLINTSQRIGRKHAGSELSEHAQKLTHLSKSLSKLGQRTALLVFDRESDELSGMVYQYLNMAFLLEANCFALTIEELRKKRDQVAAIYETLGYLDAAISVGSVRKGNANVTRPVFIASHKTCSFKSLYHPLLEYAVPNDLNIARKSILLTGSNMSGKSTFVRTVGVNAVLAQTIHSCFAQEYQAPFVIVRAFMGATDNLLESKSHYLAEVKAVHSLVTAPRSGTPHLFLIDELFRGTNTLERVAAAKAVLEYLNRGDDVVLAATHDIELVELLKRGYECIHFREIIHNGQMTFDYKLRSGVSSTRNAIAMLELCDYPETIVCEALHIFEQLKQSNRARLTAEDQKQFIDSTRHEV
ncbi:MAG TPA: hypothetical protein VN843_26160 [Anaerolineales bacterium]|nr:hypothetical protein [Anaerolineales bacterium]